MAVLAEPIIRLVYQRGAFGPHATDLTSTALVWWSISLPFQGVSLLFSRTFFSLQQPWATTALAGVNLLVNAAFVAVGLWLRDFILLISSGTDERQLLVELTLYAPLQALTTALFTLLVLLAFRQWFAIRLDV